MEENDGMVRIRLVFDDRHLLDKLQRSQGYHRCWFLFKPDITNIGDLASQIRNCFGLRHRIVLFMDEFALPSFESTCIIKNKDIILVKRMESKQKDMCKTRDDGKSQEKLLGNGSCDKETLISYVENGLHLTSPGVVGSTKQKRKHSKKHLDSKHKEARRQMVSHSSDGEQNVASLVPLDYIHSEPREHGTTKQAGETQKPLLFEEGSNKEPVRNKENSFPKVINNDQCLQVDGTPIFEGILPLPKPEVMSSTVNIPKPCKQVIHLEILLPLRRLPVKGDILTYRYVESSSLVHPQLSSPQVGEVSSFDDKTLQIVLLPVLDYVFLFNENPHGTIGQPNASLYKEDGSLEIEYLSLVDVRLVKAHEVKEKACQDDQVWNDKWDEASLKGNWNDPNACTAEQSNSWAQWIPNKSATAMSCSFKRHNAPFAGRGNGRTNWASNRSTNNWMPNKNTTNWDPNKNSANWNPNRSQTRFTSTDNISTLPRLYSESRLLPNPWVHHQNKDSLPSGSFFGSEKQ